MVDVKAGATEPAAYEKGKLYQLNVGDVQPDPEQPRKYFWRAGPGRTGGFHCRSCRVPRKRAF